MTNPGMSVARALAATGAACLVISLPVGEPARAQDAGTGSERAWRSSRDGVRDLAVEHVKRKRRLGLSDEDLAGMRVAQEYRSAHNGVSHIYLRQRVHGIEIANAKVNVNVDRHGDVSSMRGRFARELDRNVNARTPELTAAQAISRAVEQLALGTTEIVELEGAQGPAQKALFRVRPVSVDDVPVQLAYYLLDSEELRLTWEMVIRLPGDEHWWQVWVDAVTGQLAAKADWVAHASYEVFEAPKESPYEGPRTLVVDPADPLASPLGWHDIDGFPGSEWSITRGNNVYAQAKGFSPDGGPGLDFRFPLDLQREIPSQYVDAATTNLFYWANLVHDVLYQYGFDEASGNFQENNYGQEGIGGDPLNAYAQNGLHCWASSGTPPDGRSPSIWIHSCPRTPRYHDGALDNGVIVHEYCHGLTTRLTGGPQDSSCLINREQGREGWSDFCSLFFTAKASDTPTTGQTIANYLQAQAASGPGLRKYPYTTNMFVNPLTYGDITTTGNAHESGEIWASLLWEMYWELVSAHGFDPDLDNGSGGNNLAMQLMVDGLKLQPCMPGFVDARDAILEADRLDNDGSNECRRWKAFAKRGLGYLAEQGDSTSVADGSEDFSQPPACLAIGELAIDILPFRETNRIRLKSRGPIPVAVLGSALVDVSEIDPSRLSFGPGAATPLRRFWRFERKDEPFVWVFDLNGDGFDDLVTLYRARESGIAEGDAEACLVGRLSGVHFEACDAVVVQQRGFAHAHSESR